MPKDFQPVIRQNSRTGCARCKERRIKCDQARPACRNCVVRRYTCPGYSPVLRWKEVDGPGESNKEGSLSVKSKKPPSWNIRPDNGGYLTFPKTDPCRIDSSPLNDVFAMGELDDNNYMTLSRAVSPSFTYSPRLMPDRQTTLLWHYFRSVCVINSCCDASLDPLRSITQDLMSSSRLIYFCILSMSAAHLRRVDPQWSLDSAEYLSETVSTLRKQLANIVTGAQTTTQSRQTVEQTLLGVIMLGMTTSWHGTSGLGLEHIQGSRALFQRYIYKTSDYVGPSEWPKLSFYLGLQAYWESIASFLLDQDIEQLDSLHAACISLPVEANRVNPWTGVDSTLWVLLAKAGCLVRKRRTLVSNKRPLSPDDSEAELESHMHLLNQQAITLEGQILSYTTPDVSQFEATADNQIIISHLELIARCCRFAALLELYRAFSSACNVTAGLKVLMKTDGAWLGERIDSTHVAISDAYRALALGMLQTLRSIPEDSNTKCLHSLLLLIAGSALSAGVIGDARERYQYEVRSVYGPPASELQVNQHLSLEQSVGLSNEAADKVDSSPCDAIATRASPMIFDSVRFWRGFVQERMTYLEGAINLDGMGRIKTILNKVWDYNDSLESSTVNPADNDLVGFVHWIDIMEAYELEFLF